MVWANTTAASKPPIKTVPTIFSKTLPTLRFINSSSTDFLNEPNTVVARLGINPRVRSNSISVARKSKKFYHEETNFPGVECSFDSRRPLGGTMCLSRALDGCNFLGHLTTRRTQRSLASLCCVCLLYTSDAADE